MPIKCDHRPPALTDREAIGEQWVGLLLRHSFERSAWPHEVRADIPGECPERFQNWLRDVYTDCLLDRNWAASVFLSDVERLGFVRAVLLNVDRDDIDNDDHRRWPNLLPNVRIVPAVLRYALTNETDAYWRSLAVKWLPHYVMDRTVVEWLLTAVLAREAGPDTYHAAVHLTELAPDTPGLAECLLDAACDGWCASRSCDPRREAGADRAIACLEQIGTPNLLPALSRALLSGRIVCPSAGVQLYLAWGGSASELVRCSWDVSAGNPARVFEALRELPATTPGVEERLVPLALAAGGWAAAQFLAPLGRGAEVVLLAVAELLAGYGSTLGQKLLDEYFSALPAHPERWTDEDRWVMSLRGQPDGSFVWAVYADWLDDRSDPRAELVRARIGLGQLDATDLNPADQSRLWELWEQAFASHRGWNNVCDRIRDSDPVG